MPSAGHRACAAVDRAATDLRIDTAAGSVSAILTAARAPIAILVLAHGAGAGMRHSFMTAIADGLAARPRLRLAVDNRRKSA